MFPSESGCKKKNSWSFGNTSKWVWLVFVSSCLRKSIFGQYALFITIIRLHNNVYYQIVHYICSRVAQNNMLSYPRESNLPNAINPLEYNDFQKHKDMTICISVLP